MADDRVLGRGFGRGLVCIYSLGSYHVCVIIPGIYYILDASFKSGRTDRVLDGHV